MWLFFMILYKLTLGDDKMNENNKNSSSIATNSETQTASEKKYNINPERDFNLCDAASATELTGLFARAPKSDSEVHSYQSIYNYQVRPASQNARNL